MTRGTLVRLRPVPRPPSRNPASSAHRCPRRAGSWGLCAGSRDAAPLAGDARSPRTVVIDSGALGGLLSVALSALPSVTTRVEKACRKPAGGCLAFVVFPERTPLVHDEAWPAALPVSLPRVREHLPLTSLPPCLPRGPAGRAGSAPPVTPSQETVGPVGVRWRFSALLLLSFAFFFKLTLPRRPCHTVFFQAGLSFCAGSGREDSGFCWGREDGPGSARLGQSAGFAVWMLGTCLRFPEPWFFSSVRWVHIPNPCTCYKA